MKIETARLFLIPLSNENVAIFYDLVTNPWIRKYLFDDTIFSRTQIEEIMEINRRLFSDHNYGLWLIYSQENEEIMGFTGLWPFFNEDQPQLLYALLPQFTGAGYAQEAALKIINLAFEKLNFTYLEASCDKLNMNSIHTAVSLGMTIIGEKIINGRPMLFFRINRRR